MAGGAAALNTRTGRAASVACLILALLAGTVHAGQDNALERYVRTPDSAYVYQAVNTLEAEGYRAHVLEMTSQVWRTPQEVDRTVWKHFVTVIVPRTVRHRTALLYISGGRSTSCKTALRPRRLRQPAHARPAARPPDRRP